MATPEEILNIISKNVSRQNRFSALVRLPTISELSSYTDNNTIQILEFYCQDSSLPSQTAQTTEVKYLNRLKYAVKMVDLDTIILKFYDTKELIIRDIFTAWHEAILPMNKMNVLKYFPNQYRGEIDITIHEQKYKAEEITPISIGDFILSHTAQDSLGTFDVTFKIKKIGKV